MRMRRLILGFAVFWKSPVAAHILAYIFPHTGVFLPLKIVFVIVNSVEPDEMPHYAAFLSGSLLFAKEILGKVRKTAKIRKRYNLVPHLTQGTTWESNKNSINITNKSQEASPFPAGDHKAAMNIRDSMRNTRHKNANDPQKKYRLGTASNIF